MSLESGELLLAAVRRAVEELGGMRRHSPAVVALKMEGITGEGMQWLLRR